MPAPRPTPEATLPALLLAAQALAAHHKADLASRPDPLPEYFEHPMHGLQANCVMVPLPLLNGLLRAVTAHTVAKAAPPVCPAPVRTGKPLAVSGLDC